MDITELYDLLADHGLEYGPAFQALTAAWRQGEEIYAEVSLSEEQAHEAGRFGIHPALLDGVLHGTALIAIGGSGELRLPFSWGGVGLFSAGASALRVRICLDDHALVAVDESGVPVLRITSATERPLDPEQARAAQLDRSLYRVEWQSVADHQRNGSPPRLAIVGEADIGGTEAEHFPDIPKLVEAIGAGVEAPDVIAAGVPAGSGHGKEAPEAARENAEWALAVAQEVIAAAELAGARLTILTRDAVAVADGVALDLTAAPVWGLVRAALAEHPGRFALIDLDGTEASSTKLPMALVTGAEEPQLALREGAMLAPRLALVGAEELGEVQVKPIDPDRTVLITGGVSGLGALVARHMARDRDARHLLLVSRSGMEAEGARELQAELEGLGAETRIVACDVSDRDAVAEVLDSLSPQSPLGAVIHCAGVLDDGVLVSMDAERLQRVMGPKADAAWHLHELTAGLDLSQFVMFSSVMGVLGGAAQANYAAASTFLDALAALRHSQGLPASSLAWGGWISEDVDMIGRLSEAARGRLMRLGFEVIDPEQGLELLDQASGLPDPLLVPVRFNAGVLREQAKAGALSSVLRGLIRVRARREAERSTLVQRLAAVPESERETVVLDLVRSHVAVVLGHASAARVEPDRAFQEMGFDSLASVELRNRLEADTGLPLAPALVFDYPSPAAIASKLLGDVGVGTQTEQEVQEGEVKALLVKLETSLSSIKQADGTRERVSARLRSLLVSLAGSDSPEVDGSIEDLSSMSHEEMFELIDEEFGRRE